MASLEATDPSRPGCALLPADECRAVITAAENVSGRPAPEHASRLGRTLLGLYRRDDVNDPEVYATGIAATLAEFPAYIAERVCNPVTGLPGRLKFLPSIAEVREALEAEDKRQRLIVARARWMIQERERRDADDRRRAEIAAQKVDPAKVDAILDHWRKPKAAENAA